MAISTLTTMRRSAVTGLILACLLAALWSSAAAAHPGATVFTIQVGAPTSISIVVPADYGKVIDRVEITNAPGFQLEAGEPPPGWTVTRTGDTLVFSGGRITLDNEFAVFAIRGVAPTKGRLLFPVTTHSPDGTVMRYDGGVGTPNQGAIVYAGITPHVASQKGFPWIPLFGGIFLAVGVAGTGYLLWRRRRTAVITAT
jgi:hypothetical protein